MGDSITIGDTCGIARDIIVDGALAFKDGERVTVEKIEPNAERPENKYVVLSHNLQRRYQLSEDDIVPLGRAGPVKQTSVVTRSRGISGKRSTILVISGLILLLVIGGIVFVLLRSKYPNNISLSVKPVPGAEVKGLSLLHTDTGYKIVGKASTTKDGELTVRLKLTTDKADLAKTIAVPLIANQECDINQAVEVNGRVKTCLAIGVSYQPFEFTAKDYPTDPGLEYRYFTQKIPGFGEDSQPVGVSFTLEGPWDFSAGPTEGEIVRSYIAPKDSPDYADFPEANVARKADVGVGAGTLFYVKADDSMQVVGGSFTSLLSKVPSKDRYTPPILTYKFPFKVGDAWDSVNDYVESGISTGSGRQEEHTRIVSRNSIKVPQGDYDKCYLAEITGHYKSSDGQDYTQIEYTWLVPSVGAVAVMVSIKGEQYEVFTQASSFWRLKYKGLSKPGV